MAPTKHAIAITLNRDVRFDADRVGVRPADIARAGHLRQFMTMHYTTVFSVSDFPPRFWWFPAFGLILVIVGARAVFVPDRPASAPNSRDGRQDSKFMPWVALLFGCFWTGIVAWSVFAVGWHRAQSLKDHDFHIVEGRVAHFVPMPAEGHAREHFDVNGVHFEYSDDVLTGAFNQSASHGGPIREGLPVRIAYKDGDILRLEVGR